MDVKLALQTPNSLKQILLYLYGYQTDEEQSFSSTVERNGAGFNMVDASILSSFAQQIIAGRELSDKQYNLARLLLPKYHNQLEDGGWQQVPVPEVTYVKGAAKAIKAIADQIILTASTTASTAAATEKLAVAASAGVLDLDKEGCLMFTPNVFPSKQIKTIGFTFWDGKAWHQRSAKIFPTVVEDVEKMFGNVVITPAVVEALKPKPALVLPEWIENHPSLLDYQKEAIQFVGTSKRLLLALAPRLGKSVVTILAAKWLDRKRVLVVAPLTNLRDWQNKIKSWSGDPANIVYKKNLVVPGTWTITNYDTIRLHPETFQREQWDLIVIDESLLIKNRKARRTSAITELVLQTRPEYVWLLSGAPKSKYYSDLWSQLRVVDPRRFSSFWRFVERYCIVESNQWSNYNIVGNKPNAAEELKKDLADIYFSRLQEEVTNMPPMEPENLAVAMNAYQDKMYGQMEDDFLAELPDGEGIIAASMVLTQILRLVQIASNPTLVGGKDSSPKWDALVEMLQFEQPPAIVWTSFIETAKLIRQRLLAKDFRVAMLTGATPSAERQQVVDDFQSGKVDVLVAHPAVGKFGLDLWAAKTVIYLERSNNADDYYQSLNRVRHIAQTAAPRIVHLLSERAMGGGTIDAVIDLLLQTRTDETRKLTSGRLKTMMMENRQ